MKLEVSVAYHVEERAFCQTPNTISLEHLIVN